MPKNPSFVNLFHLLKNSTSLLNTYDCRNMNSLRREHCEAEQLELGEQLLH